MAENTPPPNLSPEQRPPVEGPTFGYSAKQPSKAKRSDTPGASWAMPLIFGACVLVLLGFCIFLAFRLNAAQERIVALGEKQETQTKEQQFVSADLKNKVEQIEKHLSIQLVDLTRQQAELKEKAAEEMNRIRTDVVQKADKADVASVDKKAERISSAVTAVDSKVQSVDQSVKTVDTRVTDIDSQVQTQAKTIEEQRKLIEQNVHNINATREMLDSTRSSLMNLKTSLDRDYFVFQVRKKQPVRVGEIVVNLTKTDKKKQKCNMDLQVDDRTISKKDVLANFPVTFQKMGYKKFHELVISSVGDDTASGYVSVPKVKE